MEGLAGWPLFFLRYFCKVFSAKLEISNTGIDIFEFGY